MTVKELREMLAQFDENMEVKIVDDNWNEPIYDVDEYDGVILISAQNKKFFRKKVDRQHIQCYTIITERKGEQNNY